MTWLSEEICSHGLIRGHATLICLWCLPKIMCAKQGEWRIKFCLHSHHSRKHQPRALKIASETLLTLDSDQSQDWLMTNLFKYIGPRKSAATDWSGVMRPSNLICLWCLPKIMCAKQGEWRIKICLHSHHSRKHQPRALKIASETLLPLDSDQSQDWLKTNLFKYIGPRKSAATDWSGVMRPSNLICLWCLPKIMCAKQGEWRIKICLHSHHSRKHQPRALRIASETLLPLVSGQSQDWLMTNLFKYIGILYYQLLFHRHNFYQASRCGKCIN